MSFFVKSLKISQKKKYKKEKNCLCKVDLFQFSSYNKDMKRKNSLIVYILRAFFLILTVSILVFIFHNGTAKGEVSSEQSYSVTVKVQEAVGALDPDSPIATAQGTEFDLLHACVRDAAHFIQYFALGISVCGLFLSFAKKRMWWYFYTVPCFIFLTSALDECLQGLTEGRASQLMDFAVDCIGAAAGIAVTLGVFAMIRLALYSSKRFAKKV